MGECLGSRNGNGGSGERVSPSNTLTSVARTSLAAASAQAAAKTQQARASDTQANAVSKTPQRPPDPPPSNSSTAPEIDPPADPYAKFLARVGVSPLIASSLLQDQAPTATDDPSPHALTDAQPEEEPGGAGPAARLSWMPDTAPPPPPDDVVLPVPAQRPLGSDAHLSEQDALRARLARAQADLAAVKPPDGPLRVPFVVFGIEPYKAEEGSGYLNLRERTTVAVTHIETERVALASGEVEFILWFYGRELDAGEHYTEHRGWFPARYARRTGS